MLPVLTTALQGELSSLGIFLLSFEEREEGRGRREEEEVRLRLLWGVLQHVSTNLNKRGKGIAVVLVISSGTENIVSGMDLLHLL